MVFSDGFEVEVIPSNGPFEEFTRNGNNYVVLQNRTEYKLNLCNTT